VCFNQDIPSFFAQHPCFLLSCFPGERRNRLFSGKRKRFSRARPETILARFPVSQRIEYDAPFYVPREKRRHVPVVEFVDINGIPPGNCFFYFFSKRLELRFRILSNDRGAERDYIIAKTTNNTRLALTTASLFVSFDAQSCRKYAMHADHAGRHGQQIVVVLVAGMLKAAHTMAIHEASSIISLGSFFFS